MNNNIIFIVDYVNKDYADKEKYAKYIEQRKFFSSNKEKDFVNYVETGAQDEVVNDFVAYATNKDKSKGIFNNNGLMQPNQLNALRQDLRATESPIWHGIISFEEDTGLKLMNTYEKAYVYFKKVFPLFLQKAGFNKDNIEWFAGLHTNTENRHIHFAFYEKQPTRFSSKDNELHYSRGKINKEILNECRAEFGYKLIDNSTKLVNLRNELIQSVKNTYLKDEEIDKRLYRKLEKLAFMFPATGRLQYDSENFQNLQPYVDDITFFLLENKLSLKRIMANYTTELKWKDKQMLEACKNNKTKAQKYMVSEQCMKDLYKRLGNIVIKVALECKQKERVKDYNKAKYKYEKMQRRKHREYLIDRAIYLSNKYDEEVIACFQEHLETLRRNERIIQNEMEM